MLALASLSANVDAAGLGRLTVQSALGQPLRAEVEVTSLTREEAQSLTARLASADAFRQAGLEYNPALSNLRFAVEQRGGRYFVRITSNQPVNEPFVDLLVELNWASGKFVREYTFLLDPPELRTARESVDGGQSRTESAATAPAVTSARPAPAPAAAPAAPPRQAAPALAAQEARTAPAAPAAAEPAAAAAASAPSPAARATPAAPAAPAAAPAARAERARPEPRARAEAPSGTVEVRKGDTLGGIARNVRPEGVTLDQTIMAIYQANPTAFMGSINLVKEGANLAIPDRGTIAAVDSAAASREVRVQIADYVAYRNRLASAARSVEPGRSGQTAAGQIGAAGTDRAAGASAGDRLELSKPGAAPGAGAAAVGSQARRAGAAEQGVARDAAAKEAGARIATLEKNVADLQKLLELKNKSLADLQKQLDDAKTAGRVVTGQVGATPPPVAAAPRVEAPKVDAPKVEAPKVETPKVEAPKAEAPKAEAGRVEPPAPIPPVAAPSGDAPRAEAPKAAPRAEAAKPAPAPVAEASFMDELLDNPFVLPGLGGLALLGAGYGWYAMRRRKKVEKFEDSLIAADAFTANSLFGSTGGQSVDTSNSVFANANASTAVDVHSTEVDPIAEADVYIAYGREAQAEEILKEALKRQPERQAIRQKLLEIYSGRKDAKAFEAVAREMHDMTGGQNEEWPKVVALGLALDPANPLYGGAGTHAHSGPSASVQGGAAAGAVAGVVAGSLSAAELDFPELKVGSFDEPSSQPASSHPASAPYESFARSPDSPSSEFSRVDSDEIPSLDFDLDIDTKIERAAGAPGAQITDTITDARAAEPIADLSQSLGASFDLPSLDLDDKPAASPPASGASIGADLDLDLASLGRLSEPMPDEPAPARSDVAHGGGGARESAMRAATPHEPAPHEPTLHEPTIDLSPISLDLEPATMGAEEASFGAGGSGRWQEMATKLDLASAYEEIGDKEGARELLQEVVKGGDSGQQQKARAMLGKIG